ncbi:hypothetical protein AVEN_115496-1 [Araneus ventricosus]|uniref:Uncharacterized protein n=1 Tax=Araneus ventricosus TaxID=182803 RepID=A0A4Y2PZL8_ARAVE|nr:hypothetical protein AVEN_115496-1 [Araneus ventricosus]
MGMIWKPKDCTGSVSREDTWQTKNCSSDCIGCLCETGSFVTGMHDTERGRSVRTPQVVEGILQGVEDRPDISTREVSRAVNVPHSVVWRLLRDEGLHPYYVQKVQALIPANYAPHVEFTR